MSAAPMDSRSPRIPAGPAIVIVAAGLAYVVTAAQQVLGGDNGELASLYALGGAAHPSGYPLFILLSRALRFLPAVSPAHGAALATALMAVGGLVLLYRAMRALGASVEASTIVLAAHAFSERAWTLSTHAEVFALNAALGAAIVAVSVGERPRGLPRVVGLTLLAGLGLSNHHSSVLLAPIGLYGVVRGLREVEAKGRAVLLGLLGLAVGLTPYAYLLWVGRHPEGKIVWGQLQTLSDLVFHFRRGEYGTTSLVVRPQAADRLGQLGLLAWDLLSGLAFLPLVALAGLRKRPRAETAALIAALLLAGPAFVSVFPLSIHGLDRMIVERFHLLPQALLAVLVAPALDRAYVRLRKADAASGGAPPAWLAAPIALAAAFVTVPRVRAHNLPAVETYARNTLAIAPEGAILIGTGDHRLGAFLYAREALGLRRDVVYLDAWLLLNGWYRRRMSAELQVALPEPQGRSLSSVDVIGRLVATGRPVLLTNDFSVSAAAAWPTVPVGTLRVVMPKGAALPPLQVVEAWNRDALGKMRRDPTLSEPGTWGGDLERAYAMPWEFLAGAWRSAGQGARADECARVARTLAK